MTMEKKKIKSSAITLDEIEQFIFGAGSDNLGTFGGIFGGGIQIQQISDELAPCILAILESGEPVKAYLEIGSAAGGSVFVMDHYFKPGKIVLVDDNQHPKAHIRPYILRNILHDEIIGNSHEVSTVAKVYNMGIFFDALMIDGDHMYEGVKADVIKYGEFLRPGGFLIFHDSQIGAPYGCAKVFQELRKDKRWEFIAEYISKKHKPCGTGFFRKAGTREDK